MHAQVKSWSDGKTILVCGVGVAHAMLCALRLACDSCCTLLKAVDKPLLDKLLWGWAGANARQPVPAEAAREPGLDEGERPRPSALSGGGPVRGMLEAEGGLVFMMLLQGSCRL